MEASLNANVIRSAVEASDKLNELGHPAESSYVTAETIEAVRTNEDLSLILDEIRSAKKTPSPESLNPETGRELSSAFGELVKMGSPHAAVRVFIVGSKFQASSFLSGASALYENLISNEPLKAQTENALGILGQVRSIKLKRTLCEASAKFLQRGRPEGVLLLGAACRLAAPHTEPLTQFDDWYTSIKLKPIPALPGPLITKIADVAREFANAGRFQSAVGLGLIIPPFAKNADDDDVYDIGGTLMKFARSSSTSPNISKQVAEQAERFSRHLLRNGHVAEAAEFWQLAVNLPESNAKAWKPVWELLDSQILNEIPEAKSSTGARFRSYIKQNLNIGVPSLTSLFSEPQKVVPLENVVANIAAEASKLTGQIAPAEAATESVEVNESEGEEDSDEESKGRRINAWIEDGELPLEVDVECTIKINIGDPIEGGIGGKDFTEPDWGDCESLDLIIVLRGDGFQVNPSWRPAVLPKLGEMDEASFKVTPCEEGNLELSLSIYLATELTLLEEMRISVEVVAARAVGVEK
jgi:hypothetical protein